MDRPPANVVLTSPGPGVSFSLQFSGVPRPRVFWYWVAPEGTTGSQLLLNNDNDDEESQSR